MKKLAIISTHPIQYYAPFFKELSLAGVNMKVFYTWGAASVSKYDPDFKREITWDLPLLDGYPYQFLTNTAKEPGSHHYSGIDNPDAFDAIDQFNPDVILVYGWSWKSHLRIIRHYAGKKQIWFRGDSTLLDKQSTLKALLRKPLLWWIYRHINLAFFVGSRNKEYYQAFGVAESQLRFAPHAVDNTRFFENRSAEAAQLRKQLNIPEEAQLVLFAGKFEQKKDPLSLLAAFEQINHPGVYLLFAGNGVLEKDLKERASASPAQDRILFLPFQNQSSMPVLYQACQVFCLPSLGPGETWGLAVNEAMASGKAVIVSDKVGCAVDLVQEGTNGFVFTTAASASLTQCLQKFVDTHHLADQMGKASRQMITAWSVQAQASAFLKEL